MNRKTKNPRWGGEAKPIRAADLRASVHVMQSLLTEVDGLARKIIEENLDPVVVPVGRGGESGDRAEEALKSWINGLHLAIRERVKENAKSLSAGD